MRALPASLSVLLLLGLASACGAHQQLRSAVAPHYRAQRLGGGDLALTPLATLHLVDPGESEARRTAFLRHFAAELPTKLRVASRFDTVRWAEPKLEVALTTRTLPLDGGPIFLPTPADGSPARFDALPARFTLLIPEIIVERDDPSGRPRAVVRFAFWDNEPGRPVSWGEARLSLEASPDPVDLGRQLASELAVAVFSGTPFFPDLR